MTRMRIATTLALLAALVLPASARADDVRVRGTCSGRSSLELRVRNEQGRLRVEFEIRNRGAATTWRVVLLHERRLVWRGAVRTPARSAARVRRTYADWFGSDTVTVRAVAGRGELCRATATADG